MTTIGFIGSGHIGSQLARLAVARGYDVVLSNSRGPQTLQDLVAELGEHARAATPAEAAAAGDLVVVTTPLAAEATLPVDELAGKIVIDTNNYYPQRDGHIPELDDESTTVAERLQKVLPTSKVVKAFNHIQSAQLESEGTPPGTPGRRALSVFGDDADARVTVGRWLDSLGYDVVDGGPLAESWRIEPGTPGYGVRNDADGLRRVLAEATR